MKPVFRAPMTFAVLFICACSSAKDITLPDPPAETPPDPPVQTRPDPLPIEVISAYFATLEDEGIVLLGIHETALNTEYLLGSSLIEQEYLPKFDGLKSRIVRWSHKGGALQLLDVTNVGPSDYRPRQVLLNSFPVRVQDSGYFFVDFAEGMSALFTGSEWWASDFEGEAYSPQNERWASAVRAGYVDSIQNVITDDGTEAVREHLVIQEVLQLESFTQDAVLPVQVMYSMSPYVPDPTYTAFPAPIDMDEVGFFNIAPILSPNGARDFLYVTRFHPDKPIVFALSANTPGEYRQAIRDGILYWNGAFGGDVIEVIDAPQGVNAPDVRYNMVQWVPFANAPNAYADAQADPRTGETLHANVYLTSLFAAIGRKWSRTRQHVGALGFSSDQSPLRGPRGCRYAQGTEAARRIRAAMAINASNPEIVLKTSQDYIRSVVAHEIGHTLGLRHNFAGSLGTTYNAAERQQYKLQYVAGNDLPGDVASGSSVMDYLPYVESLLEGSRMRRGLAAGTYDRMAIEVLYQDAVVSDDPPLFCTDGEMAFSPKEGCDRFDVGASALARSVDYEATAFPVLPAMLMSSFIGEKIETEKAGTQVKDLASWASFLYRERRRVLRTLDTASVLLAIDRGDGQVSSGTYIVNTLQALGGVEVVFAPPSPTVGETVRQGFEALLKRPDILTYEGSGAESYTFDTNDIAAMKESVQDFADGLYAALLLEEVEALRLRITLRDDVVADAVLAHVLDRMDIFLTSTDGTYTDTVVVDENPTVAGTASIPVFVYSAELREAASKLLQDLNSDWAAFGHQEKKDLSQKVQNLITVNVGSAGSYLLSSLRPEEQSSRAVAQSITTLKNIMNNLY